MSEIAITVGRGDMGESAEPAKAAEAFAAYLREQLPGADVRVGAESRREGITASEVQDLWDAFLELDSASLKRLGA